MGSPRRLVPLLFLLLLAVGGALPAQALQFDRVFDGWLPKLEGFDPMVWGHLLGFGLAVPIAVWGLNGVRRGVLLVLAVSLSIEGVQIALPWRTGDWVDVGWNLVGIAMGGVLTLAFVCWRRQASRGAAPG